MSAPEINDLPSLPDFSPAQPLARGVTVLEASAGTGKTFQIATLVVRLVAEEGLPVRSLLVVTFTRAATEELVDRVRGRLRDALIAALGTPPAEHDAVLARLHRDAPADPRIAARLRAALEDFDSCLITTIHGFCQRILQQHAFESLADPGAELVTDDGALVEELVQDHLTRLRYDASPAVRGFLDGKPGDGGCGLTRDGLERLARSAARQPDARIWPEEGAGVSITAGAAHLAVPEDFAARLDLAGRVRADVARSVRAALHTRTRARRVQTYDDLLRLLAVVLGPDADPARRERLVHAVRERFTAALIDEFQDTDSVQWTIFRTLFGDPERFLYLIGDPKQAIYAFRGANVQVYLDAVATARRASTGGDQVFTLKENHRSDGRLVRALDRIWRRPGVFETEGIDFVHVTARHADDRLHAPRHDALAPPLQIRFFDAGLCDAPQEELPARGAVNARLPGRVADDIVELLRAGFEIDDAGAPGGRRPIHPGDVAVLVRSGRQGDAVHAALIEAALPAVWVGAASVLSADEAAQLQTWLAALAEPGREGPARAAAITPLFGWTARDLATLAAEDPRLVTAWDDWLLSVRRAAVRFDQAGFMVALREATDTVGHDELTVLPRLLGWPDGERRVTNLLHLAELVHDAQTAGRLGVTGTLAWLADERARATVDSERAELRLERDDAAVRVLTMHKSKGLQYPIVFAPYLWAAGPEIDTTPLVVRDPDRPTGRVLSVGAAAADAPLAGWLEAAVREDRAESMRLAYVAMTRARHRLVIYGGPSTHSRQPAYGRSALGRLLHALDDGTEHTSLGLFGQLVTLAESSMGPDGRPEIAVSRCAPGAGLRWRPDAAGEPPRALRARRFDRRPFDAAWSVYSYSRLAHGAAPTEPLVGAAPDDASDRDGQVAPSVSSGGPGVAPALRARATPDAWTRLVGGKQTGTFVHRVLEVVDFAPTASDPDRATASLEAALRRAIVTEGPRFGFDRRRTSDMTRALADALAAPWGGPLGAFTLTALDRRDRMDELRFHLPIAGGGEAGREGSALARADFADAFRLRPGESSPGVPEDYAASLAHLTFGPLEGFLTGAIDLVLRHPDDEGVERWYVADYKTNRLDRGPADGAPSGTDASLWGEMERHRYLLQAHLYTLALHRLLRSRLDGYDYDTHLGGAAYLFLRGMTKGGPPGAGVYHVRPARGVIDRLDRAFERSVVREGAEG